jgi:hypothetical protein
MHVNFICQNKIGEMRHKADFCERPLLAQISN